MTLNRHVNSVNKDIYGNYIVSARYADCIYNISRETAEIAWRLGGSTPSFLHGDGLNFSSQHDARVVAQNATHANLTFFNNAANMETSTADISSALMVQLDLRAMKASVLRIWLRPDGGLSRLRGNVQLLPNGNVFTCWSDNGYITEHSSDGELLMEARFVSTRFTTYRAYKEIFSATPNEPIAVRSQNLETANGIRSPATVVYVSWNGATDVAAWDLYGRKHQEDLVFICSVAKASFETAIAIDENYGQVLVKAKSQNGLELGQSEIINSTVVKTSLYGQSPERTIYQGIVHTSRYHPLGNGGSLEGGYMIYGIFAAFMVQSLYLATRSMQIKRRQ